MTQTQTDETPTEDPLIAILGKSQELLAQALLPSYNKLAIQVDPRSSAVSVECIQGYMSQTNEALFHSHVERVMTSVITKKLLGIVLDSLSEEDQAGVIADIAEAINAITNSLTEVTAKKAQEPKPQRKPAMFDAQGNPI